MIYPAHFRQYVIRPALKSFALASGVNDMWSPAAEILLLGTALQESALTYIVQLGDITGFGGHGFYQDEPQDINDLFKNFLAFRPQLSDAVERFACGLDKIGQLEMDMRWATIVCRLHYYRSPTKMPSPTDFQAMATFYKQAYNTALGAAQPAQVNANFQRAIQTTV